jgi:serine protease Do
MKRNIIPMLAGLLALVVIGAAALTAQEKTFNVPVPPPAGGDTIMFHSNDDGDEDAAVVQGVPHPGQAMAHVRGPQDRKFIFRTGDEGGAWLGVSIGDVNAEKAKELKLSSESGAIVTEVHENSPAAKAGLQKDDVITEFAGEKVRSAAQLRRLVRETPAGRSVTLVVSRAGQTKTLNAKLEAPSNRFFEMPVPPVAPAPMPHVQMPEFNFAWADRGARLGISGDELTSQLAQYFGVKQGKGILVREVVVGSAAEKAGLKAGDVIVAVDGQEVASVGKLRRALASDKEEKEKRKVALTIVRDKREQTLTVELEPPERLGPRRVAELYSLGIDPEEAAQMAADAAAQAREWQENGKEWQKQQQELQKEMQRLREELPPELEKEINRELQGLKVKTGVV